MNLTHLVQAISLWFIVIAGPNARQQTDQVPLQSAESEEVARPHRIAIIGAGAAGSSAAYHLSKFSNESIFGAPIQISLYDTAPRVGGRTTTVNALNDPAYPVELGASIFVKINHILYNATQEFGLSTRGLSEFDASESKYDLGVWDGSQFVFTTSNGGGMLSGLWDIAKLIWKYGMSPIRTRNLAGKALGQFLKFYEQPIFPFRTLQEAVQTAGLLDFTSVSGASALIRAGISEPFGREIIQASTRVNYAQNLMGIHGLEAMVCMSTDGAMAIEGGNWQIFDQMVQRSVDHLYLNTTISGIQKDKRGRYRLIGAERSDDLDHHEQDGDLRYESSPAFDAVILAGPLQFSNITFKPKLSNLPKSIAYVSLHVTLFTSPHPLSPTYFSLKSQADVPDTILTSLPKDYDASKEDVNTVGVVPFWSISTLGVIPASESRKKQYLYKIFSPVPLTSTLLGSLLGAIATEKKPEADPITDLPESVLSWSYEKAWHSYPYEKPIEEFDDFKIDSVSPNPEGACGGEKSTYCGRGIWYTSVIEPFISSMETSALSGMNVARLIVDELEWEDIQKVKEEISTYPGTM